MSEKKNPEFIFFVIGVVLMAIVLALVLFRGQKIKEQDVIARTDAYLTSAEHRGAHRYGR